MQGRGQGENSLPVVWGPLLSPTYGLYSGRKMMGTCGGGLRAMRKGRKDRGKSGDQPHNLGEDWERGASPLGRDQP